MMLRNKGYNHKHKGYPPLLAHCYFYPHQPWIYKLNSLFKALHNSSFMTMAILSCTHLFTNIWFYPFHFTKHLLFPTIQFSFRESHNIQVPFTRNVTYLTLPFKMVTYTHIQTPKFDFLSYLLPALHPRSFKSLSTTCKEYYGNMYSASGV